MQRTFEFFQPARGTAQDTNFAAMLQNRKETKKHEKNT